MAPISFARGAPSPECLDAALLSTARRRRSSGTARPSSRMGRAAATGLCGGARRAARCRSRARVRDGGRPPGLRPLRDRPAAAAAGPGARRGPDLRPAAEAPSLAGRQRRRRADGRRGARSRRARGASSPAAATCPSSTRSRRSRTRAAGRSARSAAGGSWSCRREYDLHVLEDDPYGLVRYVGDPPPSIHSLEGGERVTFTSSFSKTVAPGLRVGWFVVPEAMRADYDDRAVSTYISPPLLPQAIVHELYRARRVRAEPRAHPRAPGAQRDAMLSALGAEPAGRRRGARPRAGTSSGSTSRRESTRRPCSVARPRPA